jgi:protoporphyrinogen oxidase
MKTKNIAIIGGGYTGLTAAYELSKLGHKVDVYESAKTLGGLAGNLSLDGYSIELAYHHIFKTDTCILNLAKEIGADDCLDWFESSTAIFQNGAIYPFKTATDLLKFKPLKFIDRLRAGLIVLYLQKQNNWQRFQNITAANWLKKYAGRQVYEIIWQPLLRGKFDADYHRISMAWLWARINTRANSREGKDERLGYFIGGFKIFTDQLIAACQKNGVIIHANSTIKAVVAGPKILVNKQYLKYDAVLATVPSNVFGNLIKQSAATQTYLNRLNKIKYIDALLLAFTSPQKLSDFYWHNVNDQDIPYVVFVQHTNLISDKHYGGKNYYYIGAYLDKNSPYIKMSASQLKTNWLGALKKLFPNFEESKISDYKVIHLKDAQHIVDTKYYSYLPSFKTPIKNVFLANFSQIYPKDRGINYAIKAGLNAAKDINKIL